ncbi:hypothetical protein GQ57_18820 [Burkholderia sp. MSh2]|uniref:DUF4148 domain-containing protein n=1 Tax=Burkholderia paludis TaxID=1506587 RepID=A0A6J5D4H1_9BURK|nr:MULTISPECIES: DUF4148 domain-containing protein [Burkholderia]KEZ04440.1 hypothetical protein GQ57_18820 [Burkholderia sp. MSh2]CAB3748281.1 hypothetical protein LMG30113_00616 [Burkholderia paludis]VWC11983.1 hypothetical protein BPA30113_05268 [Burkholderia paludis]
MKTAQLATLFVTAALSLGMATPAAFAQTQTQTQTQGKTRTQVVNELKQAQHDGVVPISKTQYPPSGEVVARNKELHGISVHGGEKKPQTDNHDNLATR